MIENKIRYHYQNKREFISITSSQTKNKEQFQNQYLKSSHFHHLFEYRSVLHPARDW